MNRLRELRLNKHLTLIELSELININKSSIARYETSEASMNEEILEIFSKFYNVSIDYLLGKEQQPTYTITVADEDGTITELQTKLIDETKGLTDSDVLKILEYVDLLKVKAGVNNEK